MFIGDGVGFKHKGIFEKITFNKVEFAGICLYLSPTNLYLFFPYIWGQRE